MKTITLLEAARLTGIPKQTLYTRIEQGNLKVAELTLFPTGAYRELSIQHLREFCENELEEVQSKNQRT